mgnify:CR=1 FL=1
MLVVLEVTVVTLHAAKTMVALTGLVDAGVDSATLRYRLAEWAVESVVGLGMQLIPILLSIVTTLHIGSGPVYRVIRTQNRAQTS